ncbi:glycosyltransferase family 61 protein [Plastoroseomonas arctica]|uniref:Glycosyltransferase family 61 protein n=1 Tax=Plastoroseomonas arctica TaxID=1509237 RepID=A0AAF1JYF9_9PROT|nr:glycosyltransferase family 61 protein [Plastoroseomonas arctica]MBR0655945.1 glycosyltransferase family 61 protein [Plastoroseomonas arctica]
MLRGIDLKIGTHKLGDDITCHVVFPPHAVALSTPTSPDDVLASINDEECLPRSYVAGPVYLLHLKNCFVDRQTGYVLTATGDLVAETLPTSTHAGAAERAFADRKAVGPRRGQVPRAVLLTSARHANYCRWWFDCIARAFVADAYKALVPEFHGAPVITPVAGPAFQADSLPLIGLTPVEAGQRFLEVAELLIPCGLTHRNGQRVSGLVPSYMDFLRSRIPVAKARTVATQGTCLYISRAGAAIRRLKNESALLAALEPFGFQVIDPGSFSLTEQAMLFSSARLIVAPHGAALTNLLFGTPGLRLVEIFSRDGLHTSSFRHLCEFLGGRYFVVIGETGQEEPFPVNRRPRDEDIILPDASIAALAAAIPGFLHRADAAEPAA